VLCVLFKLKLGARFQRVSTAMSLAMGWVIIIALKPMMQPLPTAGLLLLGAGGLLYKCGCVFFFGPQELVASGVASVRDGRERMSRLRGAVLRRAVAE
jgi:channel protein (hemolysin III family)